MLRFASVLVAFLTLACSPAYYDLDDGVLLFGASPAIEHAETAIARLGGRTGHGHPITLDTQQAYCTSSLGTVLAVTTGRNVHVCEAFHQQPWQIQQQAIWHEIGHVFGAAHSRDAADLMYAIPKVFDRPRR